MYEDVVQRAEEAQDLIQFLCARKEPDFVFPFSSPLPFLPPLLPSPSLSSFIKKERPSCPKFWKNKLPTLYSLRVSSHISAFIPLRAIL